VVFARYSAPSIGAFGENSPQGSGKDAARFRRGRKPLPKTLGKSDKFAWSKFEQPIGWPARRKPGMVFVKAQEIGGMSGGLFFGYFLLATQKKVSRLSVREPTLK
jgi:hypothetical protein